MHAERPALAAARDAFRSGDTAAAERHLRADPRAPGCAAALRDYLVAEHRMPEALEVARLADDPVGAALERHLAGDLDAAVGLCRRTLDADAGNAAAMLYLGRALFNMGDRDAALAALGDAIRQEPDYAEAWYALAHASRACGDLAAACAAYDRALALSPGLRQARLNLGITLFNLDDALGALSCFDALLERDADDVDALVNSGLGRHLLGELGAARQRIERALELAPGHPEAHRLLAAIHNEAGDATRAIEHLERALAARPDDPELYAELAGIHELSSELDRARAALERGFAIDPHHPSLKLEMARLERRDGDMDAALTRLRSIDPESLPPRSAQQLYRELGFCLDRARRADDAMGAFENANRIGSNSPRARSIDRGAYFERLRELEAWLDRAPELERAPSPVGSDLCFLVGFPRSGTTLLDTMLDAHPAVVSVEEKPTLELLVERLRGRAPGYPEVVDRLSDEDLGSLRTHYREVLGGFLPVAAEPSLIVDKMPLRMLHSAFIRRLFPAARILVAMRHPCDVVLSNFMQDFEPSEAFVHCDTLEGTVRLYDAVMRLWARLEPHLGDRTRVVRYESLVADAAGELESVCGFLGLDWSPRMVDTVSRTANRGRVRTTSYQQVAEEIYARASGRWFAYREHFAPFLPVLEPHVRALGYSLQDPSASDSA